MGERGLVAERSQRPALCGFDGNTVGLDPARTVVGDFGVRCGADRAIRANSDGQNGRDGKRSSW